ncbi:hypothetical protein F5Y16DRAFT_382503 [Xylariaceae sp. FL0255]|nr:hypothetical protein F5Y16DRAFT_382503 [Xylariaceae sp. FL0255]
MMRQHKHGKIIDVEQDQISRLSPHLPPTSSPYAPPKNTIPLDSRLQTSDLSWHPLSGADKLEDLTRYRIFRFEKVTDNTMVVNQRNSILPNWQKATRAEQRDIPKSEAVNRILVLNRTSIPVVDKMNSLSAPLKAQIDSTLELLLRLEVNPLEFTWVIAQLDHELRRIDSPVLTALKYGSSGSRRQSENTAYERISLTAYFKRVPWPGRDITSLWRRSGNGHKDSLNLSMLLSSSSKAETREPGDTSSESCDSCSSESESDPGWNTPASSVSSYPSRSRRARREFHSNNQRRPRIVPLQLKRIEESHKACAGCRASFTSESQATKNLRKRQRPEKDDEDDEDAEAGGRRDKRKAPAILSQPPRLACPYYKKDPILFRTRQYCCGPGWETVHRLKEHLHRKHCLPISCLRCYTPFKTEEERDSHMRSAERCEVRERPSPIAGYTASQKIELKSRSRELRSMSEPQKWRRVYLILFPGTSESEIPSPYYEFVSTDRPVDPMTEYEEYLERELPHRVRQQLEARIDQVLDPVEETMRGQLVDIVRDVQLDLFRLWRSSVRLPDGESHEVYSQPNTEVGIQEQQEQIAEPGPSTLEISADGTSPERHDDSWDVENDLAAWRPEPYLDLNLDGFDGQLFDFEEMMLPVENQDSAYGTMSSRTRKNKSRRKTHPKVKTLGATRGNRELVLMAINSGKRMGQYFKSLRIFLTYCVTIGCINQDLEA